MVAVAEKQGTYSVSCNRETIRGLVSDHPGGATLFPPRVRPWWAIPVARFRGDCHTPVSPAGGIPCLMNLLAALPKNCATITLRRMERACRMKQRASDRSLGRASIANGC